MPQATLLIQTHYLSFQIWFSSCVLSHLVTLIISSFQVKTLKLFLTSLSFSISSSMTHNLPKFFSHDSLLFFSLPPFDFLSTLFFYLTIPIISLVLLCLPLMCHPICGQRNLNANEIIYISLAQHLTMIPCLNFQEGNISHSQLMPASFPRFIPHTYPSTYIVLIPSGLIRIPWKFFPSIHPSMHLLNIY